MNKVASRLLVFFIGIPIVIGIVVFPVLNHLPLHILICLMTATGACELYNLASKNYSLLPKKFVVTCATAIAVLATLNYVFPELIGLSFPGGKEFVTFVYILALLGILFLEVFTASSFEKSIERIAISSYIVTYTGFLMTFVSRMTVWKINGVKISVPAICIFLLMVFFCDSIAWFMGVLFGRNNRGVVKASPNKSVMGFIGGFIGSAMAGSIGFIVWNDIFAGFSCGLAKLIITGLFMAFSSIVGDLAESVLKRSAEIKDSGELIPGRGGVLDSIDSILISAPVFYLLFSIFFGPFN